MRGLFEGRRYGVVGLGRNGLPAARALRAMAAGVVCWDDGEAGRAAAVAEGFEVAAVEPRGLDAVVMSPGIGDGHPVVVAAHAAGVPVLSDAVLLFEAVRRSGSRARFAGVTGTNGKSTTTVLLQHLLARAGVEAVAGGNLGPASLALPLLGDEAVYVLEMSSYMLERVPGLAFDVAGWLNVSPDHLDRHGSMEGYVAAKRHIFDGCGVAVVGVDDAWSRGALPRTPPNAARLAPPYPSGAGLGAPAPSGAWGSAPALLTVSVTGLDADWTLAGSELLFGSRVIADLSRCKALPGMHNAQNAGVACAMAVALGAPLDGLAAGLESFPGLAHRQKRIATVDGIDFIDDSKATNADAASRALLCSPACIWIAGGLGKEGGIEAVEGLDNVAEAVLIGRDGSLFAATLAARGVAARVAGTLEAAVPIAFEAARARQISTVLLSPAAASFDQFSDFEARGRCFAELVDALPASSRSAA